MTTKSDLTPRKARSLSDRAGAGLAMIAAMIVLLPAGVALAADCDAISTSSSSSASSGVASGDVNNSSDVGSTSDNECSEEGGIEAASDGGGSGNSGDGGSGGDSGDPEGGDGDGGNGGAGAPSDAGAGLGGDGGGNGGDGGGGGPAGGKGFMSGATSDNDGPGSASSASRRMGSGGFGRGASFGAGAASGGEVELAGQTDGDATIMLSVTESPEDGGNASSSSTKGIGYKDAVGASKSGGSMWPVMLAIGLVLLAVQRPVLKAARKLASGTHSL